MKQPNALRLAEQLRDLSTMFKTPSHEKGVCNGASFEIRRLHEANQAMLEALKVVQGHIRFGQDLEQIDLLLSSAIAKATGE